MNMKTVIPLGLAILLGLVAAIMVRNTIAHRSQPKADNSNTVSVVTVKADVDPGHVLDKDDLVVTKVPAELAPGHVFSDPNQLVGRVANSPLARGQTVMENLLAAAGTGGGLQALIPPGMRAVTIEVNEFSSVGGMLEPGCRVDLMSNINDPKTHENMCRTILQNVKIGAIGRATAKPKPADGQPTPPPSNSVTLFLTPKQAQTLQLAAMTSRPWFMLRSSKDDSMTAVAQTTMNELRGRDEDGEDSNAPVAPIAAPTPVDTNPFPVAPEPVIDVQPTTVTRTVTIISGEQGVTKQSFKVPLPPAPKADTDSTVNTDVTPVPGQ
jgi:pilus assembly protein CpaB